MTRLLLIAVLASCSLFVSASLARSSPDLAILWRTEVGAPPLVGPALLGSDRILVADGEGRLVAVDGTTGSPLGEVRLAARVSAIVGLGPTACVAADTRLHCFEDPAGEVTTVALPAPVSAPPGRVDHRLVVPIDDGTAIAIDPADGSVLWQASLPDVARVAPTHGGDTVAIATSSGHLVVLRSLDGEIIASRQVGGEIVTPPGHAGGVYFAGAPGHKLYGIDARRGKVKWKAEVGRGPSSPILNAEGHALFATLSNQLLCLRTNGNPRWRRPLPARVLLVPRLRDNLAFVVPHRAGLLLAFDMRTGAVRRRLRLPDDFETFTSAAVIAESTVVMATSRGDLVGIGRARKDQEEGAVTEDGARSGPDEGPVAEPDPVPTTTPPDLLLQP